MHGIRSINLKTSEMQEMQEIMSKGNTLLKECAEMLGMSKGEFRGKLFNRKLDTSNLSEEQFQKLEAAKPHIMAVHDKCELKILSGFTRMVQKQAKVAASNSSDPKNVFYEFEQVGMLAVLDSIYGYTNTNIKFITYVWKIVRRRINLTINRLNPFCPLTNEAMNLVQGFEATKVKFNRQVNTEEVVEAMGITAAQREVLFAATTKVVNELQAGPQSNSDHDFVASDYTAMRRGIDGDYQEVSLIRKDARQAIKNAELSDIELHLLLGEMFPYTGWREDIAGKFINPRTGKRYTREVTGIIDRAKDKVRKAIKFPPEAPKENPIIDQIFDELSGKLAV
jgi:hypothetical protein